MMVTWVRGHFKNLKGKLDFDPGTPERASVEVAMYAAGWWTGEPDRDAHLRSVDFLDVGSHSKITFKSRSIDVLTAHEFRVNGDLTIRGVAKPVVLKTQYFGQWET